MTALGNVRDALGALPRSFQLRWALLIPFGVVSGAVEAAAAAAVFGLVLVMYDPARASALPILASIQSRVPVSWQGERELVALFLGLAVALLLLRNVLVFAMFYYNTRMLAQDRAWLSIHFFRGYLDLPYTFHLGRSPTECVRRVDDSHTTLFGVVLMHASSVLRNLMSALGLLVVLLAVDATATMVIALVVAAWSMVLARWTGRFQEVLGREAATANQRRTRFLHDSFRTLRELKVAGRESYFGERFASFENAIIGLRQKSQLIGLVPRLLNESVLVAIMAVAAIVLLASQPDAAAVTPLFGLYGYAGLRLLPSANSIVDSIDQIQYATRPLRWLLEDQRAMDAHRSRGADGAASVSFTKGIDLAGVSFRYAGAGVDVLSDVTLRICQGESIGIVGPTGAGKSTLLHVIAGLLPPAEGSVRVDGIEIDDVRRSWQAMLGYVPQTCHLLDTTLRENIAFAVPEAEIDDDRVFEVLRIAQLREIVDGLPQGIHTEIGAGGSGLSGGERQRVAIARALYQAPTVLLFDEATAALDNETERALLAEIDRVRDGTTLILIAHRLSSVQACDRLILLVGGRVEAIGTYAELMATSEAFRRIATAPTR